MITWGYVHCERPFCILNWYKIKFFNIKKSYTSALKHVEWNHLKVQTSKYHMSTRLIAGQTNFTEYCVKEDNCFISDYISNVPNVILNGSLLTNKLSTLQTNKLHKCLVFDPLCLKMTSKWKLFCTEHYSKHCSWNNKVEYGWQCSLSFLLFRCRNANFAQFFFYIYLSLYFIYINPLVNWLLK